ncbi:MAG: phytanoyl-CoA dioxygenase family protein [Pseudomonadales bacterium]|jgi:ectoine hydroxylase-related dioxygenase (phytanoyl-CoA dioxygenase family)|nr:phytanoyl-CoA dioxygenase family protein [Pseudomonadales bacterium]
MLTRKDGYLRPLEAEVPAASRSLEARGYALLEAVFAADAVAALAAEIEAVYERVPRDDRTDGRRDPGEDDDFRYEMFNRSALAQQAIAHPRILEVIEPLLGEDCHVIANTCWRNPPRAQAEHGGGAWHVDSGPHVPRPQGVPWDDRIPYPVFAIGAHLYLQDCPLACGPTGVIPGSHRSGRPPPRERPFAMDLEYEGQRVLPLLARAGDVALFVSDVWHRRLPTDEGDTGRFFLQAHYGRRDIAQRVRTTAVANHVAPEAEARIASKRERTLLGLHRPFFYDG